MSNDLTRGQEIALQIMLKLIEVKFMPFQDSAEDFGEYFNELRKTIEKYKTDN